MIAHDVPIRIAEVPQCESRAALELVFSYCSEEERRSQIANVENDGARSSVLQMFLLGAWRGERLVGALVYHVQPGKTAILQLPRLVDGEPDSTAVHLLTATYSRLKQLDIRLVQVMLDIVHDETELLRSGGLDPLAEVCYLVCEPKVDCASQNDFFLAQNHRFRFEPCDGAHERLQRVMESTYVGSADCVGLEIRQDTKDLLIGHRRSEDYQSDHWLIVRDCGCDIGCLLLVDHPSHDMMELLYMGLRVDSRGKGIGSEMLHHARQLTQQAGRSQLVTAVDAANQPAMQAYTAAGFRTWRQRRLYAKHLAPAERTAVSDA